MSAPDTAADQAAALQTLDDYYRAFSTLEVQAILPYFHEPSMLISPQGVLPAPTLAALAGLFSVAMEGLRTRDFGRSELSPGFVESLSSSATLVTGIALRYRTNGQELERVGVTYVLYKGEGGWKIAVIVLHDPHEFAPHTKSSI
jgi:hypothetical protein